MRKTYRELKIAGPRHLLPEALNPSSWSPCLLPVFFSLLCSWMGFPGGPDGKESTCNAGDSGLIPGSGSSPGEGNNYPFQYSCLENSTDKGAQQTTVCGVTKSQT